jgi:hypothetical protein
MLRAHSLFWHYLWVAPNILFLVLGLLLWVRRLNQQFPAFFVFAIFGSLAQLSVYAADVVPSVSAQTFWRVDWASLLVEGVLKFAVIGEIFALVFGSYVSLARLGRFLIRAFGVVLVFAAALAAAYAPKDSLFGIVSGAHRLDQTIYLIEAGLLVFMFLLSSYFHLSVVRPLFGIALGLSISACVHLAAWAAIANGHLPDQTRYLLDFLNMATYHVCVLIWFYYLLIPAKTAPQPPVPLPENNLEVWNRELERLVQP